MPTERATRLFNEFTGLVREFASKNKITPDEYHSTMAYVISLGEAGEWPLFLDAFFESTIDTINYGVGEWTSSTVTGPYYKEGAPLVTDRPALLPMRPDEPGQPMRFIGTIRDRDGNPVPGAVADIWHATNDGIYSFPTPGCRRRTCCAARSRPTRTGVWNSAASGPCRTRSRRTGRSAT